MVAAALLMAVEVNNQDSPANGQWDFKMQNVWSVDNVGEEAIATINQLKVSDKGKIYIHDRKNKRFYIFSAEGKFLKAFGKKGEGPGEIKWMEQAPLFLVKDTVIAADIDKVHYFTADGDFIRSVKNSHFTRPPRLFLDKDTFITAQLLMMRKADEESKIKLCNLKTGEEKNLADFSIYKGGRAEQDGMRVAMIVRGLTPLMILGYHDKKIYFGMNSSYTINIAALDGKAVSSFQVDRKAPQVTEAEKRERFGTGGNVPKEMLDRIIKQLPDTGTYFDEIEVHNGLIFVYLSVVKPGNFRKIDIFSLEGKYLYRAEIKADEGMSIRGDVVIKDGYLYLGLEDEEGEFTVNKYKIQLPTGI
jgi:hypothetical protein